MGTASVPQLDLSPEEATSASSDLLADPRWQAIQRITDSDAFRKSSRLPALLRYLARCTLTGERSGLTEQMIGKAVFDKRLDYTPAEDSSVRVYVRQLRLRLHEYNQTQAEIEPYTVLLPKGGYALTFTPNRPAVASTPEPALETPRTAAKRSGNQWVLIVVLSAVSLICAIGWVSAVRTRHRPPWPLDQVIGPNARTTVVLADAGYALRLLGDHLVPLDQYIDRSFAKDLVPKNATEGESRLIHYLAIARLTSMADAHAAAALTAIAAPYSENLVIKSAKDLNADDLSHGDFVFVGARSSNPWVELFNDQLNFQFVEEFPLGHRYILNRKPQTGESKTYNVVGATGSSGSDYATISLLPARNGAGKVLLIQGLRMEGTEAALQLLEDPKDRDRMRDRVIAANGHKAPEYFEVLLRAQSVAGSPMSLELLAVRAWSGRASF